MHLLIRLHAYKPKTFTFMNIENTKFGFYLTGNVSLKVDDLFGK